MKIQWVESIPPQCDTKRKELRVCLVTRSLTKVYYYVGTLYFAWDLESCWMGISVWKKNIATLCMKI